MKLFARELTLAETAFLHRMDAESSSAFGLRWFTPAVEVDLCGHATIASAHWLWETQTLPASAPVKFHTKSGVLGARRNDTWIELDFPATTPQPTNEIDLDHLSQARGAKPKSVLRSRFDAVVELESPAVLRSITPDMTRLKQINARGVIVTAGSDEPRYDFISRFFAPQSGVDEDPVTGSAHCALAPYWAGKLGKTDLL